MIFEKNELQTFLGRFAFNVALSGYVGIEREHFLVSADGMPIPHAAKFLARIKDPRWTYELSACQVESRTKPHRDHLALELELLENRNKGTRYAKKIGVTLVNREVGQRGMSVTVFPDARYAEIVRSLTLQKLTAACRVTGTHIHLGVKDMKHAIAVYNALIPHGDELCALGDHSKGKRLGLYKTVAKNWCPIRYENQEHFFEVAQANKFAENPRNCWTLIRISIHGTVELRMFGVTDSIDEILSWVSRVQGILHRKGLAHA